MPASSLVRFAEIRSEHGRKFDWGRVDVDGLPYSGPPLDPMPESQMEERLVPTADAFHRTFDLDNEQDSKEYAEIRNRTANGWTIITLQNVFREKTTITRSVKNEETGLVDKIVEERIKLKVYLEWLVRYMTDGQPFESQRPYIGRSNT